MEVCVASRDEAFRRREKTLSDPTDRPFLWKLVLALAPIGLVFAALTITGSIPGLRATQWTILLLLTLVGLVIALRAPGRPFRQGLVAGFLVGLVAVETQALFLGTYFANNPEYADVEIPFGLPPRLATALLGPLNAALAGLIAGVVAWLLWNAIRRRSALGA